MFPKLSRTNDQRSDGAFRSRRGFFFPSLELENFQFSLIWQMFQALQQETRIMLGFICFRWAVLCQTDEGEEVHHHDGPVPDQIWECAEWRPGAALHHDGHPVGRRHPAELR